MVYHEAPGSFDIYDVVVRREQISNIHLGQKGWIKESLVVAQQRPKRFGGLDTERDAPVFYARIALNFTSTSSRDFALNFLKEGWAAKAQSHLTYQDEDKKSHVVSVLGAWPVPLNENMRRPGLFLFVEFHWESTNDLGDI